MQNNIMPNLPFMDVTTKPEYGARMVMREAASYGRASGFAASSRSRNRGALAPKVDRRRDASRRASRVVTYTLTPQELAKYAAS